MQLIRLLNLIYLILNGLALFWFNSNQMKFSEIYLPAECLTDKQPFETKVPHNPETRDK
jgi:hypothetical protein